MAGDEEVKLFGVRKGIHIYGIRKKKKKLVSLCQFTKLKNI